MLLLLLLVPLGARGSGGVPARAFLPAGGCDGGGGAIEYEVEACEDDGGRGDSVGRVRGSATSPVPADVAAGATQLRRKATPYAATISASLRVRSSDE